MDRTLPAGARRAAIFDLDGTLVDSAPDIHAAANAAAGAEGLAPLSLERIRRFVGNGAPVLIARILAAHDRPDSGPQHARMLDDFLERYQSAVTLSRLYPGVRETLDRLAAAHVALGLCTNKPEGPTRAVLDHFGLADRFCVVVAGDSLPRRKPDPLPLHHAARALGDLPAVFVGDSEVDAETAQRAPLPFVLYTRGYRQRPDEPLPAAAVFDDFGRLPEIVDNLVPA